MNARKLIFGGLFAFAVYMAFTQRPQIARGITIAKGQATRGYTIAKGYIMTKAAEIIKQFEGFSLKPYKDSAGRWTVGYGHLLRPNEPIAPITQARADELLEQDMKNARDAVTAVKIPLTENQHAALVSLAFNIGAAAFRNSTLVKKLNARDFAGAADEFPRWNKITDPATGQKIQSAGLSNRRAQEKEIFTA